MNCKKRYLKQIETMNIYHQFIIYLQFLEQKGFSLDEKVYLEKHHILPFHAGGKKNGPVVLCTTKNHMLAHYYRSLSYGELGDKVCFKMRQKQTMLVQERSLLGINKMRQNKINFFKSNWQRVQGSKPKKTKKSNLQLKACQQMGLLNQTPLVKKRLSKKTKWTYKKNRLYSIEILPSVKHLIEVIKKKNDKLKIKPFQESSLFYKVLKGQRKQAYGWKLVFVYL